MPKSLRCVVPRRPAPPAPTGPAARRGAGPSALALAGALAVVLGALGGCAAAPAPAAPGQDGPVVLASFTVLADMARVVGGPDVTVVSVTKPGMEVHGYEPTPDDLRRAARADLLLVNGMGLEGWVQGLVDPLDLPTVVLTEDVEPVVVPGTDVLNPHAWMSPRVGAQYADAIAGALADLDPPRAAAYHRRAADYRRELEALHEVLLARLAEVPERHAVLVTCEGAFSYLARDAGLAEEYLWPVNAERQGTPRQVGAVILAVREAGVPAVFCESTVSPAAQAQVARETGAELGGTLFVDSLSGPEGPVPTYLDLLRHDVAVIVAGLTGEETTTEELRGAVGAGA